MRSFIFVLTLCFLLIAPLAAENDQPKPPVGIVEKLGNMLPLDTEFYDEDGHLVSLKSIITKPTVFTFVYYKCPGICSPLLTEVTKVVSKMDLEPGVDYQLVTISFDHEEKPDLAKEKQENYIAEVERPMPAGSWRFFTGDSSAIASLTDAAGFYFARDGRDWIHAGVLIIASPQGKVTRYLFGIKHLPFDVKMAVMEASEGKTGPTIAKVLSFCFTYDPEGKRYAFDVVRVSGVVIVAFVAVFAIVFLRRKRK
ncbi:MAG: SCO family protein [Bacteroidetes bacterium]|nr:SCO family protein [Bacteroidota bacterium]